MGNKLKEENEMDYRISKTNRRETQERDAGRRNGISRMGQPPVAARGDESRKERDRKRNLTLKRARDGKRWEETD
jgi:hypothetical protein